MPARSAGESKTQRIFRPSGVNFSKPVSERCSSGPPPPAVVIATCMDLSRASAAESRARLRRARPTSAEEESTPKATPEARPPKPAAVLESMHNATRGTRGAAVAVCELDPSQHLCRFAGVGNIGCAVIVDAKARHMVSHNGIVGHSIRKIQEFSAPWPDHAILVMHSDGLSTQWDVAAYPGLSARHPALIAAVLYRDFSRQRDDVTVLVAKQRSAAP